MATACPEHGLDYQDDCRICRIRNTDAATSSRPSQWDSGPRLRASVLVTTTDTVPGRDITTVHGLVIGIGHPGAPVLEGSATRGRDAWDDALNDLRRQAASVGANAVIGLTPAVYSGGRSLMQAVGVHLAGTAVTIT